MTPTVWRRNFACFFSFYPLSKVNEQQPQGLAGLTDNKAMAHSYWLKAGCNPQPDSQSGARICIILYRSIHICTQHCQSSGLSPTKFREKKMFSATEK
jgi:hypothetical protein